MITSERILTALTQVCDVTEILRQVERDQPDQFAMEALLLSRQLQGAIEVLIINRGVLIPTGRSVGSA